MAIAKRVFVVGGLVIGIAFVAVGLLPWKAGSVAKTFRVGAGSVGQFAVGETKDNLLARPLEGPIGLASVDPGCSPGWIDAAKMSGSERQCFLYADKWRVELVSSVNPCFPNLDSHTEIEFRDNRLTAIATVCTYPE